MYETEYQESDKNLKEFFYSSHACMLVRPNGTIFDVNGVLCGYFNIDDETII